MEDKKEKTIEYTQKTFDDMLTELKARKIIFDQSETSKSFNQGLDWAIDVVNRYKKGEGLFQL